MHDRFKNQVTTADPLSINEWPDFCDVLPALNLTFDHPVERALSRARPDATGHHPRGVCLLVGASKPVEQQARFLNPFLEISEIKSMATRPTAGLPT
jgi:hypothetical protein